jgi:hypothetical protein
MQRNDVQSKNEKSGTTSRGNGGPRQQKKKYTGKALHTHIRQLMAELNDTERNEFNDIAEEQGFY